MNTILKSWKTTLAGVLSVVLAGVTIKYPAIFTPELDSVIVAVLAGFGLIVSKDGNVTGK